MDDAKLKTCKMCYREIDERARKCPYCLHWQFRWSTIMLHPAFVMIPLFLFLVVFLVIFPRMIHNNIFHEGEKFRLHAGEITIQQSELKFGELESGPTVVVLGTVRNSGEFSWKEVYYDVQLFDGDNNLIDATQKGKYSFVIPANGSSSFKVSFPREFPEEHYVSHKVRVVSARDARARF